MILKFDCVDIKQIIEQHLDELIYGISDMNVEVHVDNDTIITCVIEKKETK